jgi:competence protein CoiA
MLYAINETGDRVTATPQASASCPMCLSPLVAKCGRTVAWHWSHCSLKDCDEWAEGETPWHLAWKSRFADSEVTITRNGKSHRADVVSSRGKVIEFQHSTISAEEIEEREEFYGDMVWVLDVATAYSNSRIGLDQRWPEAGEPYCKFKWNRRKTSFDASARPIFLDLGLASCDVGDGFFKQSQWWDDSGLKDGVRRESGRWARTVVSHFLLEIKKSTDRFGWGRLVSRSDFCRRFGGDVVAEQSMDGVRRDDYWPDHDGYVLWSLASQDSSLRSKLADMKQKGVLV